MVHTMLSPIGTETAPRLEPAPPATTWPALFAHEIDELKFERLVPPAPSSPTLWLPALTATGPVSPPLPTAAAFVAPSICRSKVPDPTGDRTFFTCSVWTIAESWTLRSWLPPLVPRAVSTPSTRMWKGAPEIDPAPPGGVPQSRWEATCPVQPSMRFPPWPAGQPVSATLNAN